ncbi:MAG: CRTAC1 family protein [Thermoanaerobaculia bacterium]|nr:CRTAC1 family protein [Thermoanaerobaculia bacterium]
MNRFLGLGSDRVSGLFVWLLALSAHAQEIPDSGTTKALLAARQVGLEWVHVGGERDRKSLLVEENGSGVALFDYDGDGDLDLYFVNGSRVEWMKDGIDTGQRPGNVLYRNDGDWNFVDVTVQAAVGDTGWGQGVAVGDVEGDGDLDLFVANYGQDVFYENRGDGRFEDATGRMDFPSPGVGAPSWGAGAAFADFDSDGDLDLYVSRYLDLDLNDPPKEPCEYKGVSVACGPIGFPPQRDQIYENRAGAFVEISASVGLTETEPEFGLGVLAADLDFDGLPDVVVANDSGANFLLKNVSRDSIRFEETAWLAGVATSQDGRFQAGMGVDAGDVDGDGIFDLFLTHFIDDHSTLYLGVGSSGAPNLLFRDASYPSGLGGPSRLRMAWGTRFFDADLDGDLDIYVGNGHLYPEVEVVHNETYAQPDQLFLGNGSGRFGDASSRVAGVEETVSRGVATGDLDGDGDLDVVVSQLDRAPLLLENRADGAGWLRLDLGRIADLGTARVVLEVTQATQLRHAGTSGSYASASDPVIHFGLGDSGRTVSAEVWVGPRRLSRWHGLESNRTYVFRTSGR